MNIHSRTWSGTGPLAGAVLTALTGGSDRESEGGRPRSGRPRLRPGFGGAVLAVALATCPLTGCTSASPAVVAGTSPSAEVTAPSPAPSAVDGASGSSGAVAGASGSSGAVAPVAQGSAGCANLVATPTLKATLARVEGKRRNVTHLKTSPRRFYYGRCDNDEYAGGWFQLTADATEGEQVQMQDENAGAMYFTRHAQGSWRYIATSGVDPMVGCTKLPAIPHALARLWNDCPVG